MTSISKSTKCVGKLCPDNLELLNKPGITSNVVVIPYVHENGFYVGLYYGETFPEMKCPDSFPFDCAENLLSRYEIQSKKVTHISLSSDKMFIFVNLDSRLKSLKFVEVSKLPKRSYKSEIQEVLNEKTELERRCSLCGYPAKEIDFLKEYPKGTQKLGSGAYGTVILRESNNGEKIALKRSPKSMSDHIIYPDVVREISALRALQGHPNIVQMIGFSVTERQNIALEVAEMALSDALKDGRYGGGGEGPLLKQTIFQIIKGMHYINSVGIWHRDLKPQNILIFPGNVIKITDFGLARGGPFQWISTTGVVYTLWYRAPEILLQEVISPIVSRDPSIYTSKAEVFSVGMCLWDLLNGDNRHKKVEYMRGSSMELQLWKYIRGLGSENFDWCVTNPTILSPCNYDMFRQRYITARQKDDPSLKLDQLQNELDKLPKTKEFRSLETLDSFLPVKLSDDLRDLFKGLMHPDPNKRMTMNEAIKHPYFKTLPSPLNTILSGSEIKQKQQELFEFQSCKMATTHKHLHILTDWLEEVKKEYHLSEATLSLGCQLLICYLRRGPIPLPHLQGVGISCLYLASLYMDTFSMYPEDVTYITDNTVSHNQLEDIVRDIFLSVGGLMHLPTPFLLLMDKIKDLNFNKKEKNEIAKALFKDQISLELLEGKITNEEIAEKHAKIARAMKSLI